MKITFDKDALLNAIKLRLTEIQNIPRSIDGNENTMNASSVKELQSIYRNISEGQNPVVVLANFSYFSTSDIMWGGDGVTSEDVGLIKAVNIFGDLLKDMIEGL